MEKGGAKDAELRRTCPNCGERYRTSKHKCPECGAGYRSTLWKQESERESDSSDLAPMGVGLQGDVAGGVVMIGVAAVWFWVGYERDYTQQYAPLLAAIGVLAVLKGLRDAKGVGRGRRRRKH